MYVRLVIIGVFILLSIRAENKTLVNTNNCESYIAFDTLGLVNSQKAEINTSTNVYLADIKNSANINQISAFEEDTFIDWSPDGYQFAYSSIGQDDNIFIYNIILKTTTPFIPIGGNFVFDFSWSPNGTKIAYITSNSESDNTDHLYLLDVDGGTRRNLTPMLNIDARFIDWSPDSQLIALRVGIPISATLIIDVENQHIPPIILEDGIGFDWLGDMLVFSRIQGEDYSYYTYNINNGEVIELSENMGGVWSFDGKYMAYYENDEIYIRNSDTDEIETLRSNIGNGYISNIVWSPYSLEIVFFEPEVDEIETRDGGYIYIKNLETGEVRNALGDYALYTAPLGSLGWSPCIEEPES